MRLYFIDRLDNAIFSRVNPKHEPASGGVICTIFIASMVLSFSIFICQMCNVNDNVIEIIGIIGLVAILAYAIYACLTPIKAFDGWGGRIGYSAFILVLSLVSFYLAMWTVVLALTGLVLYVIVKVFFAPKKKGIIRYSDGTEEEAVVETGILGEDTFTGCDSGNSFTK